MNKTDTLAVCAAERLKKDKAEILEIWLKIARSEIESAKHTSSHLVRDEFLKFLSALSELLLVTNDQVTNAVEETAKQHGAERARFTGYTLGEIVKEYGLLRATVIASLEASGHLTSNDRKIINSAVDDAIGLAIAEFDLVQTIELKKALKASEMSNAALEQFAAVAAHDLQSPLGSIAGFTSLIRERYAPDVHDEASEWFDFVERAVTRMSELITATLSFARLSSATADKFDEVDLNRVISECLEDLKSDISRLGATVTSNQLPIVRGDRMLLHQLFQNLIGNALKFHSSGASQILISSRLEKDFWLIEVKDNGIGFDMKDAELIFDVHRKLSHSVVEGGAGLGLATCRKIVEVHGGTITARSAVGEGSVFTVSLPSGAIH